MLEKLKNLFFYLVALLFVLILPYFWFKSTVYGITEYRAAQAWPTTRGAIIRSNLVSSGKYKDAKILYAYEVDGQDH